MRVKDWQKFQHYKRRNPPWIKLHKALLDDPEFHALPPLASKVLAMCWLVASENDGNLPAITKLAFRLRMDSEALAQELSKLSHWLIEDASVVLAERLHDATPETETETKKKEAIGAKKVRTYSAEFDQQFWQPYPRTPVMSKAEAWTQWKKLSETDRAQAIAALPRFKSWLATKPDHPVVHACRFLSQRRFDGFDGAPLPASNDVARYLA